MSERSDGAAAKKKSMKREVFEWVASIAVTLIAVYLIRTFLFTMILVDGPSMMETLQDGDRVAVTILDLKINGPQRGDIVICTYPGADHLCIKRVVGMPGDTLEIQDGLTYLNGELYEEPYVTHRDYGDFMPPTAIEEGHYFVMGDNRANSNDSRSPDVGALERGAIGGKTRLRVWPFDQIRTFD